MSELKDQPTQEDIQAILTKSFDLVDTAAKSLNDFEFRGDQRNVCAAILTQFQLDPQTAVILEAPTGSGKSIIAKICIIAITNLVKATQGYILTSDRLLQDQYNNSCNSMIHDVSYGNIYGASNYICHENNKPHPEGVCKVARMSSQQIKELKCYSTCGYFQARLRAQQSKIALMNYNNWLLHMNMVNGGGEQGKIFDRRAVTFFDECHKIGNIVQEMFSFSLYTVTIKKLYDELKPIFEFHRTIFDTYEIEIPEYSDFIDSKERILSLMVSITDKLDTELVIEQLEKIDEELNLVTRLNLASITVLSRQYFGNSEIVFDKLPKDWQDSIKTFERFDEIRNQYRLYLSSLYKRTEKEESSALDFKPEILHKNLVVDQEFFENEIAKITEKRLVFRTIDISSLMHKYVLTQANFKVFMSASIGDIDRFAKLNGFTNYNPIRIGSTFKFKNSGIVRVCQHNLGAKYKHENIGPAIELMDKILSHPNHINQRGIIHSGNYEFARMIKEHSIHSNRILMYQGTEEKLEMLKRHAELTNSILVGPSLVEGVDLADDLARVMIMFKVPYPNLGDNLNRRKLDQIEGWYEFETLLAIVQMLGRPIRHENDSCATYLLDSNFQRFFDERNAPRLFPDYIVKRIK